MRVLVFADQSHSRQIFIREALRAIEQEGAETRTVFRIARRAEDAIDKPLALHADRSIVRSRKHLAMLPLLLGARAVSPAYRGFTEAFAPWSKAGKWVGAAHATHWTGILARARLWRPDLLFVHFAWNLPVALPFARFLRRPIVCVLHGSDVWLQDAWRSLLPAPEISKVFCVSEALKAHVDAALPAVASKTEVLRNPMSPAYVTPTVAPPDGLSIVCVAGLIEVKNHVWLLRALAVLKARGAAFHCTLVGAVAPGDSETEQVVRDGIKNLALDGHTTLAGWLSPEETAGAIDRASVLVLPSRSEGFGMVLVEALARERTPVATRLPGTTEALGEGRFGILCPLDEDEALADAILAAHRETTERSSRLAEGRAYAIERHSPKLYAERFLRATRELVHHRG